MIDHRSFCVSERVTLFQVPIVKKEKKKKRMKQSKSDVADKESKRKKQF